MIICKYVQSFWKYANLLYFTNKRRYANIQVIWLKLNICTNMYATSIWFAVHCSHFMMNYRQCNMLFYLNFYNNISLSTLQLENIALLWKYLHILCCTQIYFKIAKLSVYLLKFRRVCVIFQFSSPKTTFKLFHTFRCILLM